MNVSNGLDSKEKQKHHFSGFDYGNEADAVRSA